MKIVPNEVESIEDAGMLDGHPVKMIRTKGGFWIAVGRPKGKINDEAIGAGSHPAIVKYNVEKQYPGFQPSMMKSEFFNNSAIVDGHSHFLSDDLRKSGYEIHSIQTNNTVDFLVTKYGLNVATIPGTFNEKTLHIKSTIYPQEFVRAVSGATLEKATSCGATKIRLEK